MEKISVNKLLNSASHPYTLELLNSSRGKISLNENKEKKSDLLGCKYFNRCSQALGKCKTNKPGLFHLDSDHEVRCFLFEKESR